MGPMTFGRTWRKHTVRPVGPLRVVGHLEITDYGKIKGLNERSNMQKALEGIRVISLAINLPGPLAAYRLGLLGAEIRKIEPPSGDPLNAACPGYYQHLSAGQHILALDLKSLEGQTQLEEYLATADLLLTAHRPSALQRLRLDWETLHRQFPRLCHVALLGFPPPREELPGHDLLFQALYGLLDPPHMPKTLVADLGAAERLVSAAMAVLLARERTGEAGYAQVSIAEAGESFALPLRYGLTTNGPLGGTLPSYGIYRAQEGFVALAVLEAHFLERFAQACALETVSPETLEALFLTRTAKEWEIWAWEHRLPLAEVR